MTRIANKYELKKVLGEGGFGSVYLAQHIDLGVNYALKLIKVDKAQEDDFMERFKREAQILSQLLHRNSIPLRDFGKTSEGYFYMAMDYCPGQSLKDIIKQRGPLPYPQVLHVTAQILDVLSEAHRLGIVHRDLKPDNIMVERDTDGQPLVKVLDFGIAKLVQTDEQALNSQTITKQNSIMGTPMYMSPEQATNKGIDARSDIYSLGMVIYHLLAGVMPFDTDTDMQTLICQMQSYPVPFAQRNPQLQVPGPVEQLVFKSIQKDQAQRFQNAMEFRHACLQVQQAIATGQVPPSLITGGVQGSAPNPMGSGQNPAYGQGGPAPNPVISSGSGVAPNPVMSSTQGTGPAPNPVLSGSAPNPVLSQSTGQISKPSQTPTLDGRSPLSKSKLKRGGVKKKHRLSQEFTAPPAPPDKTVIYMASALIGLIFLAVIVVSFTGKNNKKDKGKKPPKINKKDMAKYRSYMAKAQEELIKYRFKLARQYAEEAKSIQESKAVEKLLKRIGKMIKYKKVFKQGQEAFNRGNYKEAKSLAQKAYELNNSDEARRLLSQASEINDYGGLLQKARQALRAKKFKEAVDYARRATNARATKEAQSLLAQAQEAYRQKDILAKSSHGQMFRNSLQLNGRYPDQGKRPIGKIKWKFHRGMIYSTPTILNGIIYFGAVKKAIFAISAKTKRTIWKLETEGRVFASPAIYNGFLYIGDEEGYLYCVNIKEGKYKWKYHTGSQRMYSSPVVVNNMVLYGNNEGYLFAIDAQTGREKWKVRKYGPIPVTPSVYGNNIYNICLIRGGGLLVCSDMRGQERWKLPLLDPYYDPRQKQKIPQSYSDPVISNHTVYVTNFVGMCYAVDAKTGREKWKQRHFNFTGKRIRTGFWISCPAASKDTVFFGNPDTHLYAVDAANGRERWRFKTKGEVFSHPALCDGVVYFGSRDGHLYAVNMKSGEQIWKVRMGSWLEGGPAVADGVIYTGHMGQKFWAIR